MRRSVHGYAPGPRPIFGTYHAPAAPARNAAFVICPPHGWESIQCYHSLRVLGETLANAGFHVFRAAYQGTGESPGTDEEPDRVRSWLDSIHQAVDCVSKIAGVDAVGLIGIRLGATLAAQAAAERAVAGLVLWEPCLSGTHYAREMEILASAAPKGSSAPAPPPSGIDAGGYVLTKETLDALGGVDLMKLRLQGTPAVLLLGRDDRPAPTKLAERLQTSGCATRVEQPRGFKQMMMYPEAAVPAAEGFERILSWAFEHSAPAVTPGGLELHRNLERDGTRRSAVALGADQRLFGVVTEPVTQPSPTPPAVLFLTGGVVPRTAVNRMYVMLADELARRGHRTLRFDVSGIGESDPEPGLAGGDPYPPSLLHDARAALGMLRADDPARPVWLVGLCSGAYAAFRTALGDPLVAGIVMFNPLVYRPVAGSVGSAEVQQHLAADHYRQAMFDPERWRRLLAGGVDVRRPIRFITRRAKTLIAGRLSRVGTLMGLRPGGTTGELLTLLRRGTRLHVIFAAGDPGVEALRVELGGGTERIERAGADIQIIDGADHTFNSSRIRRQVMDRVVGIISSR